MGDLPETNVLDIQWEYNWVYDIYMFFYPTLIVKDPSLWKMVAEAVIWVQNLLLTIVYVIIFLIYYAFIMVGGGMGGL